MIENEKKRKCAKMFKFLIKRLTVLMLILIFYIWKTHIKIDRTRFQQTSSWEPLELEKKLFLH